jgi:hypothetical protein
VLASALPLRKLGGDKGDLGSRPRAPPMLETLGFWRLLFLVDGADFVDLADLTEVMDDEERRWSTESPTTDEAVDSGLLGFLEACLGGCGKAPMLTALRSDLPADSGLGGGCSVGGDEGVDEAAYLGPGR